MTTILILPAILLSVRIAREAIGLIRDIRDLKG